VSVKYSVVVGENRMAKTLYVLTIPLVHGNSMVFWELEEEDLKEISSPPTSSWYPQRSPTRTINVVYCWNSIPSSYHFTILIVYVLGVTRLSLGTVLLPPISSVTPTPLAHLKPISIANYEHFVLVLLTVTFIEAVTLFTYERETRLDTCYYPYPH